MWEKMRDDLCRVRFVHVIAILLRDGVSFVCLTISVHEMDLMSSRGEAMGKDG